MGGGGGGRSRRGKKGGEKETGSTNKLVYSLSIWTCLLVAATSFDCGNSVDKSKVV